MQRCFSSDEAELLMQLRGSTGLQTGKIILCFSETNPRGAMSCHIHPHSHSCPGGLDSQPYPCVGRGAPLPAGNEQPRPNPELFRWDWALSPLTGLHLELLVFFTNNLLTVFSAQKPLGACCPTEEVTQSIIHSIGFANWFCSICYFSKRVVGRGGE